MNQFFLGGGGGGGGEFGFFCKLGVMIITIEISSKPDEDIAVSDSLVSVSKKKRPHFLLKFVNRFSSLSTD